MLEQVHVRLQLEDLVALLIRLLGELFDLVCHVEGLLVGAGWARAAAARDFLLELRWPVLRRGRLPRAVISPRQVLEVAAELVLDSPVFLELGLQLLLAVCSLPAATSKLAREDLDLACLHSLEVEG